MIFVLYVCREKRSKVLFFVLTVAVGALEALQAGVTWMFVQCAELLALVPMLLYDGRPGKWKWKYFFYAAYPAHMLLLYVIHRLLGRCV